MHIDIDTGKLCHAADVLLDAITAKASTSSPDELATLASALTQLAAVSLDKDRDTRKGRMIPTR